MRHKLVVSAVFVAAWLGLFHAILAPVSSVQHSGPVAVRAPLAVVFEFVRAEPDGRFAVLPRWKQIARDDAAFNGTAERPSVVRLRLNMLGVLTTTAEFDVSLDPARTALRATAGTATVVLRARSLQFDVDDVVEMRADGPDACVVEMTSTMRAPQYWTWINALHKGDLFGQSSFLGLLAAKLSPPPRPAAAAA